MAQGTYKLELESPKRNVFVTQLHQRDDEEDDGIAAFPVVKESAGKLLETGLNTLQKTLLLKKEVEVEKVNEELREKREEFRKRMEACAQRQIEIQKRQQKMKDRVNKFEKFIKENEAKRRRAIQKYQQEVKLKEQKEREYELLCKQQSELQARNDYLKNKLAKYEKFKNYLLSVVDILPAHYLEVQDSMVNSLMMRHRTLSDTNKTLIQNLVEMGDELEVLKQQYKEMKQDHNKMKVAINSELSQRQKWQEINVNHNQETEQRFLMDKIMMRARQTEQGQILMAVDNLAEKCKRRIDPNLDTLGIDEKLDIIKKYVIDRMQIVKMVQHDMSSSPVPENKSASPRPIKPALKAK